MTTQALALAARSWGMGVKEALVAEGRAWPAAPAAVAVLAPAGRLCERICEVLTQAGACVVAIGPDLAAIRREAEGESPDAVVIAVDGGNTLSPGSVTELREALGDLPVVVVVPDTPRRFVRTALRARADGVLHVAQVEQALVPTLSAALARQVVVPREQRRMLAPALSHRERQVLALAVLGHANAQIAARLFLSESTVKSHLTSAFAKLGVISRDEAAALVLDPDDPLGPTILASIRDADAADDDEIGGPSWR